jgi:hypothetical protein
MSYTGKEEPGNGVLMKFGVDKINNCKLRTYVEGNFHETNNGHLINQYRLTSSPITATSFPDSYNINGRG